MTRKEFLDEVVKNYFKYNCKTADEAIEITKKQLNISKKQFIEWFGRC